MSGLKGVLLSFFGQKHCIARNSARGDYLIFWIERGSLIQRERLFEGGEGGRGALISIFKFRPQTNIVFISTKHNIQPILKANTVGKCLVAQGCCRDFFWQVSNIVSQARLEFRSFSAPYILCIFPLGRGGGCAYLIFLALRGRLFAGGR